MRMSLITWKEEYNLGIEEIDAQHKKMFAIINDLFRAMKDSDEKTLKRVLGELVDYADYHFSTEEGYFEKLHYPEKESHIKTHQLYREKIMGFVLEYKDGEKLLPYEILDFLEDWWIGHITGVDRQYIDTFHKSGLA
jgi:hemerythrin-like metal-binding protein